MSDMADRWLAFAREDLRVAEIVLGEGIYNQVCFHAQQCIEKALKSALAREGRVPPRIHSITDLLRALPADWLAEWRDDIAGLDDYYIPTRYPDALPGTLPEGLPGRIEAEEALVLARIVLDKMEQIVSEGGSQG
jgi:HEPN domain-containing protein